MSGRPAAVESPGRLDELARFGVGREHLAECTAARSVPVGDCDWCCWAILTPELAMLVVVASDARALLASAVLDTVAGVVAAAGLRDALCDIDLGELVVPSARHLAERVRAEADDQVARVLARVRDSTRPGGPIDERCRRTAGALAVVALQAGNVALDAVPDAVRGGMSELSSQLSSDVQLSSLLPVIDELHWRGMVDLTSQPEWGRRPAPGDRSDVRQRQLGSSGVASGSLEALVIESMIDRCTERLFEVGELLRVAGATVRYERVADERPYDRWTRATVWRLLDIDWHLTFADSGLAHCWGARTEGDALVVDVPWIVDLAVTATTARGFASALYYEQPDRRWDGERPQTAMLTNVTSTTSACAPPRHPANP